MKKSILFVAVVLGLLSGYFFRDSGNKVEENSVEKNLNKAKSVFVNNAEGEQAPSPTRAVEELPKAKQLMLGKDPKISEGREIPFVQANKSFIKKVNCIKDGSCLASNTGRFYDKSTDPAIFELSTVLGTIVDSVTDDNQLLNELSTDELLESLSFGHTGINILASDLLLRIGENTYNELFVKAKSFESDSAKGFLRLVYDEEKYHGPVEQRRELVEYYLSASDQNTVAGIVNELNKLELTNDEAQSYVDQTCQRVKNGTSESDKIIRYDLGMIARKFSVEQSCKI